MFLRTLFPIIFAFQIAQAQVILTEVMFDPEGPEAYDEFVEIYNLNPFSVDLNGWRVGDSAAQDLLRDAGQGLMLQPQHYGIILDPGYFENSTSYDSLIPPEALVLTIDAATFGANGFLNSQSEPVLLIDANGDTVQIYRYSVGNDPGYSDEKIILSEDNSHQNWGNSTNFRGTPGLKNSISPKDMDLAIILFRLIEENILVGQTVHFEAMVKNLGQQTINGFEFRTFYDLNSNEIPDSSEIIESVSYSTPITPGDSLMLEGKFDEVPAGQVSLGIAVAVDNDEDLSNNVGVETIYVSDPGSQRIIINEIMAAPNPGYAEWVELFNPGTSDINLGDIYFADARDTVRISQHEVLLQAGEYVVIGGDSAIATQYGVPFENLVIMRTFPTLNNDFDELKLLNNFNFVYDRVSYTNEWYGREVGSGISLEKINPNLNGQTPNNWAASVDAAGSTPGRQNSVFAQILPVEAQLDIHPNPFSPDGDGHEDVAIIQAQIPVETAFLNIRIYDTRGRLMRFLADSVPVAHQTGFVWDGKDDDGRVCRIGAYICFVEALNPGKNVVRQMKSTIILVKQ